MNSHFRWSSSLASLPSTSASKTINPAELTLSPSFSPESRRISATRNHPRPLHFQPPTLSFFTDQEVQVNAVLGNKHFPVLGDLFKYFYEQAEAGIPVSSENPTSPEGTGPRSRPGSSGSGNDYRRRIPKGVLPITTWEVFAQTGGNNKKLVSGVNWEVLVTPEGIVYSQDKKETTREGDRIAWDLGDVGVCIGGEDIEMDDMEGEESDDSYIKASEKRKVIRRRDVLPGGGRINWVNYRGSEDEEMEWGEDEGRDRDYYHDFTAPTIDRRLRCGRFWMLHPPCSLPPAFFFTPIQSPNLNVEANSPCSSRFPNLESNTFILRSTSSFLTLLNTLLIKLTTSFPNFQSSAKTTSILHHFEHQLDTNFPKDTTNNPRLGIKFLSPKEVQEVFPTTIEPIPDFFLRLFVVIWIVDDNSTYHLPGSLLEIVDEDKVTHLANGILEQCAGSTMLSRGSGRRLSTPVLKVLEWGGIVLSSSVRSDTPPAGFAVGGSSPGSESSGATVRVRATVGFKDDEDEGEEGGGDVVMADGFVVGEMGLDPYYAHESDFE